MCVLVSVVMWYCTRAWTTHGNQGLVNDGWCSAWVGVVPLVGEPEDVWRGQHARKSEEDETHRESGKVGI